MPKNITILIAFCKHIQTMPCETVFHIIKTIKSTQFEFVLFPSFPVRVIVVLRSLVIFNIIKYIYSLVMISCTVFALGCS